GVVFTSSLIPGQTATCTVTVTATPGMNAVLNAWIDFDKNGKWSDPGEQIAVDLPVVNGLNVLSFQVPAGAAVGVDTFARFRLSTVKGLSFAGPAPDGEVEDYKVSIGYKWVQEPDLSPLGIDVNCTAPFILADDFQCDVTGPITDIHIWCSWFNDMFLPDPGAVKFRLSIHKDIPAGPQNYSMPGEVLWWREFGPEEFTWQWAGVDMVEGWMDPPQGYIFPGDHNCIRYDFRITEKPFIQRGNPDQPVVYWLNVQAQPLNSDTRIGWKTSVKHWNDDAVWGLGAEPYLGPWQELRYPPRHELQGQSIDLAFAITGKAQQNIGTLTVKYNHTVPDHFWWRGHPDPDNEMMSILGAADLVENILWTDVTLQAYGTGNDASDIAAVKVWLDNDNNGVVSPGDVLLGSGSYPVDNGTVTIAFAPAPVVPAGGLLHLVISYSMASGSVGSTYWFDLVGASGVGQSSGLPVNVVINPSPLTSAKKIVGLKPITIGQAKLLPIGTQFLLENKICTANFQTNMSLVYIEEPDRTAGIGILTNILPVPPVSTWDRVSVLGTCQLINRSELVVVPQEIAVAPGMPPMIGSPRFPVGMNNKYTGGGDFGSQPAVFDVAGPLSIRKSVGLNNVGMLITTWGKVTYHEGSFPWRPFLVPPFVPAIPAGNMFWIDDGTNLVDGFLRADGTLNTGIACWVGGGGLPNVGDYLSVTGILRAIPSPFGWPTFPEPVRLLVPRTSADLVRYEQ
ncbi:MAG: GEVED domain-containing protein, partial [Armatimonadota bacterium]|nr:GEVED domain-containing protein [Armatimonadota bacterium]